MIRELGISHLTLLELSPPELVEIAAAVGVDFVGVRVKAVTDHEPVYPMSIGSPMLRETIARLNDTGLRVADIEFLPLTGETIREDWIAALESGQALGATALTVTGADPVRTRLLDTLGRLAEEAAVYGIRPLLEPISYQPVNRAFEAGEIAEATGAGVMLDSLHVQRAGSTLEEIAALDPGLLPVVQLCDAPLAAPAEANAAETLKRLQYEARNQRRLVGEGELDLEALLRILPGGLPVSLEIPHAELQSQVSSLEYAKRNVHAARALIAHVDNEMSPTL